MGKKIALLIGVSESELGLEVLLSAVKNAEAMEQVLTNPERGDFAAADVTVLRNPDRPTMAAAVYTLFENRQPEDLLLLYFSGHGLVEGNEFYFTNRYTRKEQGQLVPSTALEARSVQAWMEQSRSQRQVVVLDSCLSGALGQDSIDLKQFLGTQATTILAASTSTLYALPQEGSESVYTHYWVEGICTGAADLDEDGAIAVEELHAYASRKVKQAAPAMTPGFYPAKDGRVLLSKSPSADPRLTYRRQAEQLVHEGRFSFATRRSLTSLRRQLGLGLEGVDAIEAEVLQPHRDYQRKLKQYEQTLAEAAQTETPLSQRTLSHLKAEQHRLALRDQDIALAKTSFLSPPQPIPMPTPPFFNRQQFLKWAGLSGGGLIIGWVGHCLFRNSTLPKAAKSSQLAPKLDSTLPKMVESPQLSPRLGAFQLSAIDFETVTADNLGQVVERNPRQAALVKQDLGKGIALEMIRVPKGEFLMGTAPVDRATVIREMTRYGVSKAENPEKYNAQKDEAEGSISWEVPQHGVRVPEFLLGRFAVTQAQWSQVASFPKVKINLNPDPADFKGAKRPVEQVSWEEAVEFCDRLSRETQQTFRLPSEAEWEYACRAGTTTPFYFGPTVTADLVNYDGTYPYGEAPKGKYREQTIEVGSLPPNEFGLCELHGNVWEWCADPWHETYKGAPIDGSVWKGGNPEKRLVRGGSFVFNSVYCRSANRLCLTPANHYVSLGFRIACSIPPDLL